MPLHKEMLCSAKNSTSLKKQEVCLTTVCEREDPLSSELATSGIPHDGTGEAEELGEAIGG